MFDNKYASVNADKISIMLCFGLHTMFDNKYASENVDKISIMLCFGPPYNV